MAKFAGANILFQNYLKLTLRSMRLSTFYVSLLKLRSVIVYAYRLVYVISLPLISNRSERNWSRSRDVFTKNEKWQMTN